MGNSGKITTTGKSEAIRIRKSLAANLVVGAFLSFLERDMRQAPERLVRLSGTRLAEARKLVAKTRVGDDGKLLKKGQPPDDWDTLMKSAKPMRRGGK